MTDWNEIVARHGQVVWNTAWRLLSNHADASDCYQKTFLDAVRVDGRETVRDWPALLKRLATAQALDLLRDRYRQAGRRQPLADPSSVPSSQPGPEKRAEEAELAGQLRAALAELPDRQAEAFYLQAVEGMTYREVADRLRLDTNAVGVLLNRARKRLRRILASVKPSRGFQTEEKP
jgi:RNA polymerase sigma factor (sigma-70 family)